MTQEEAYKVLVGIHDQHMSFKERFRREPYSLLADKAAADKIVAAHFIYMRKRTIPITGAEIHTPFGMLQIVRVPDTGSNPLLVDAWGQP